jgi:hypothetical protein
LEYDVGSGRLRAELYVRLVDLDVRSESLLVKDLILRREVSKMRDPKTTSVGQLHQTLTRCATKCLLADEICALIAVERRREHFCRTTGALVDEEHDG